MTRSHQIFLAAVGAGLVGLVLLERGLVADRTQRNYEVFRDMADSVPYDAFAPNPCFADGKTLQVPVAGTVPRGLAPLRFAATPEDAKRAGVELANPFAADPAGTLERGRKVFAVYCAICHGATGQGDGPVTRRGVPPPPPLTSEKVRAAPDGQLFHIVTFGQGNMASYASQIERDDRWRVIRYVRTLKEPGP